VLRDHENLRGGRCGPPGQAQKEAGRGLAKEEAFACTVALCNAAQL